MTSFSLMTYNVLADGFASPKAFDYVAEEDLKWENRRDRIIAKIKASGHDIVCLQEVQSTPREGIGRISNQYDHAAWFFEQLGKLGYIGLYGQRADDSRSGAFKAKNETRQPMEWGPRKGQLSDRPSAFPVVTGSEDVFAQIGQCIFWKPAVFEECASKLIKFSTHFGDLIEERKEDKDWASMKQMLKQWYISPAVLLRHRATDTLLIVASPHLPVPASMDPENATKELRVPIAQVQYVAALMEELKRMVPGCRLSISAAAGDASGSSIGADGAAAPSTAAAAASGPLIPVIIAGDFNAKPDMGCCELLRNGSLPAGHKDLVLTREIANKWKKPAPAPAAAADGGGAEAAPAPAVPATIPLPYPNPQLGTTFNSAYAVLNPSGDSKDPPITNFRIQYRMVDKKPDEPAAPATTASITSTGIIDPSLASPVPTPVATPAAAGETSAAASGGDAPGVKRARLQDGDVTVDTAAPAPAAPAAAAPEKVRVESIFEACLDYIWYSTPLPDLQAAAPSSSSAAAAAAGGVRGAVLRPLSVMPLPSREALLAQKALPSRDEPSDHVPLAATFEIAKL